jgi:two-component system sensor histidine kinase KdpD
MALQTDRPWAQPLIGLTVWLLGWGGLVALDSEDALANQALVLVATAALATRFLPAWASGITAVLAVAAFNWNFVPPRNSFTVDLRQHAALLLTLLVVIWTIAALMDRQRRLARSAQEQARRESHLRQWADVLQQCQRPEDLAQALARELAGCFRAHDRANTRAFGDHTRMVTGLIKGPASTLADTQAYFSGSCTAEQRAGLLLCQTECRPLGPGTGRYEQQADLFLPLRHGGQAWGATLIKQAATENLDAATLHHLQALCDLMGQALQRRVEQAEAQALRDLAREHLLRNTLLTAVAHDHRTPLATILGAASSLVDQGERLTGAQRSALAQGIMLEAQGLARLTDNTLQLARLDASSLNLNCDWQSAEELVGSVVQQARRRHPQRRIKVFAEPNLPLLWCDATLVSQALDNLLDNALKYSAADAPVEVSARALAARIVLAVSDRGPGVPLAWQDRIFEPYVRVPPTARPAEPLGQGTAGPQPKGAGLGLALCRAVALAHGVTLRQRPREQGGSIFELEWPVREQPEQPT